MTAAELATAVRSAGAAGVSWGRWSRDVGEQVAEADACDALDVEALKAAHAEGLREHRLASGWRKVWTTAPESYDLFGTETVKACGEWRGKQLRVALVDPAHLAYQSDRYGSGLHLAREEDPRVEEARWQEEQRRERVETEERAARRLLGLEWLAALPDVEQYDEDERDRDLHSRCLTWDDYQTEQNRREAAKKAAERATTWARCRAAFEDGATLVDEGTPGVCGHYGWIKGRDPDAWRSVKVEPHYACKDDAEEARVVGEGGPRDVFVGTLALVADRIEKGEMRVAGPDEHVPPRAVLERLGSGRSYKDVVRVEVGGRVAWVGERLFEFKPVVLDEAGKLVRARALREAGERAWRERQFGGGK